MILLNTHEPKADMTSLQCMTS